MVGLGTSFTFSTMQSWSLTVPLPNRCSRKSTCVAPSSHFLGLATRLAAFNCFKSSSKTCKCSSQVSYQAHAPACHRCSPPRYPSPPEDVVLLLSWSCRSLPPWMASAGTRNVDPSPRKLSSGHLRAAHVSGQVKLGEVLSCLRSYQGKTRLAREHVEGRWLYSCWDDGNQCRYDYPRPSRRPQAISMVNHSCEWSLGFSSAVAVTWVKAAGRMAQDTMSEVQVCRKSGRSGVQPD